MTEELNTRYEVQVKDLDGNWNTTHYQTHFDNALTVLETVCKARPNKTFRLLEIKTSVICEKKEWSITP